MKFPQTGDDGGKGIELRFVEGKRPDGRLDATEAKRGRTLLDADQFPTYEGLQCGRWQFAPAQVSKRKLATICGQFGKNGLLESRQVGKASVRNQDGKALGPARVTFRGGGFTGNPFFTQHSGQHGQTAAVAVRSVET